MRLTDFHLLLLEDDPALLARMVRAVRQARLGSSVQVVRDHKEAIDCLLRLDRRSKGVRVPSLFLLDLEGEAGLMVLDWLHRQPNLRRMVKVGLYSSDDGAVTARAYQLGINSCLARPDTPAGLAEMFTAIRQYWVALNQPPQL